MKTSLIVRRPNSRLNMPLSARNIYRIAFFVCLALWLYSPSLSQPGASHRLLGMDIAIASAYSSILFFVSLILVIITGILWWRESRRVNGHVYQTIGVIDLQDVPYVDPASAHVGVKRAMKRWFMVFLLFGIVAVVTVKMDIGAIIRDNSFAMFVFIFMIMAACVVAAYAISNQPTGDADTVMGRFAERNGMHFYRPIETPEWIRDATRDITPLMTDWMVEGVYREGVVEIALVSYGDRYDAAYLVQTQQQNFTLLHNTTIKEKVDERLLPCDGVINSFSEINCVINISANDSRYNKAALSRIFAAVDVVVDAALPECEQI